MTSAASVVRVMVLEDDRGTLEALKDLLTSDPGMMCVGAYGLAETALRRLAADKPDVAIVDLGLPQMTGIEFLRACRAKAPKVELLVVTVHDDSDSIFQALAVGASGYVIKGCPPEKILEAIREVQRGGAFMSGAVARRVLACFRQSASQRVELGGLSPREHEVLGLLAEGLRYVEIAHRLGLSVRTINTHLYHVYRKLHVRTATGAVSKFLGAQTGSVSDASDVRHSN